MGFSPSITMFSTPMTPGEFKQAWEKDDFKLVGFPTQAVATLLIPEDQREFLVWPGLPESAAPYLDFGGKHYVTVPSVADLWKAGEAFRRYRTIGANGFGDPICIDEDAGGAVVYLNHDDDMKRCFMNSNVYGLALTLVAFREVVRATHERGGSDGWLSGQIPNDVADHFVATVDAIDPPAIKPGTFWFRSITGEGV